MDQIFENECLDHTDYSNHCLIGVKFINCLLRFCDFQGCDLSYTTFENCDLYRSNFDHAVIYTTRLHSCDLTKARFVHSFLNGIRIKDTIVTYTEFGYEFKTSMERKPCKITEVTPGFYECATGPMESAVSAIEQNYQGIYNPASGYAIKFSDPNQEDWRIWRRKSETAKVIKNILEENGYKDKSIEYYFFHRKFLRKSMQNKLLRSLDYFWGELFWGYGTKIANPVIGFFINSVFFSIVYAILPYIFKDSGMKTSSDIIYVIGPDLGTSLLRYLDILYGSILISSLSVFGNIDVAGWAKLFSLIHILISVLSIGLGMASLTKKMANV